jgi:hypothetical protein
VRHPTRQACESLCLGYGGGLNAVYVFGPAVPHPSFNQRFRQGSGLRTCEPYEMMAMHFPPSPTGQVLWWQERWRSEGHCGRAGLPRCVRCATIRRWRPPALLQTVHGEAGLRVSGRKIAHQDAHHYVVSVWHMGVVACSNWPKAAILALPRGSKRPSRLLFLLHDRFTSVSSLP